MDDQTRIRVLQAEIKRLKFIIERLMPGYLKLRHRWLAEGPELKKRRNPRPATHARATGDSDAIGGH